MRSLDDVKVTYSIVRGNNVSNDEWDTSERMGNELALLGLGFMDNDSLSNKMITINEYRVPVIAVFWFFLFLRLTTCETAYQSRGNMKSPKRTSPA